MRYSYKHFVNIFSKTKQTKFEFSNQVPTAAFDMVNDAFLINKDFFIDVASRIAQVDLLRTPDQTAFFFLLGHELGHQWWTVHDISKFKEPISFYKFVQNVVEDTYIEPAWYDLHRSRELYDMADAMRIGRAAMVPDEYCKQLEQQELTLEIRLQMLIAYSYNKDYQWSVEFLPQHLLDFFHETYIITDDQERFEKEIVFADMLIEYFGQEEAEKNGQDGEPSDDPSDIPADLKQKLQEAVDKLSPEFQPNESFSDQKDMKGTIISKKDVETLSEHKMTVYSNTSSRNSSSMYDNLLINFSGTFNKYKFRTHNGMSYNERKGEVDMHNIPFSNVRTDFFKKQNNFKREFDLEFVLLFDYSGSMDSIKHIVSDIGASFSIACLKNHIPVSALAFTDETFLLFNNTFKNKDAIKNLFFNAVDDINGSTNFYHSLKYADQLLNRSLKKDKVIMILTDGDSDMGDQITELVDKTKHYIIPIAIDIDQHGSQFEQIFNKYKRFHYHSHDFKTKLPNDIIKHLYDTFMKGGVQQ